MKKAFTLVEMLVVIAIIGILATAVIVSLGPARYQARDSRIQGNVQQLRNLAETHFNTNNFDYRGFAGSSSTQVTTCADTPSGVQRLCQDISTQNGGTNPKIFATQNSVAIFARLASPNRYICMDTSGNVKTYTTDQNLTSGICP
jgi:prepilin-type N-terminal cleavage/methylation domain-containing protein